MIPRNILIFFSFLFIPLLIQAADVGAGAIFSLILIFGIPLLFIIVVIGAIVGLRFIRGKFGKLSLFILLIFLIATYILTGIFLKLAFPEVSISNILIWPIAMWNTIFYPLIRVILSYW